MIENFQMEPRVWVSQMVKGKFANESEKEVNEMEAVEGNLWQVSPPAATWDTLCKY